VRWQKKGLIYAPDGTSSWAKHSALTPTPIVLNDHVMRVYVGFRDEWGVSRIGYVDVDAYNPSTVLSVSPDPVLDVGIPGTFDDNGIILGDVFPFNDYLYMYYIGFQLVEKVKFLAFTGLAISGDWGNSFIRYSQSPILDRTDSALYFRAIHSTMVENGMLRVWIGGGRDWQWIDGQPFPKYNIRYLESKDGINFAKQELICVNYKDAEYRIGRPRVIKLGQNYKMFYTRGTLQQDYLPGYAESQDGIIWTRMDNDVGIGLSETGWDSQHLSYSSIITFKGNTYMFYNGNNMGKTGFGYAVLEEW
jgi:hypothetical protein